MGYIIIDEKKLEDNLRMWNDKRYRDKAMNDVVGARVDYGHMLEALQTAEKELDAHIEELQTKKSNIQLLMKYAK